MVTSPQGPQPSVLPMNSHLSHIQGTAWWRHQVLVKGGSPRRPTRARGPIPGALERRASGVCTFLGHSRAAFISPAIRDLGPEFADKDVATTGMPLSGPSSPIRIAVRSSGSKWHEAGSTVLNWAQGTVTHHQPWPARAAWRSHSCGSQLCPVTLTHLFAVLLLARQPKPQPQAGLKGQARGRNLHREVRLGPKKSFLWMVH